MSGRIETEFSRLLAVSELEEEGRPFRIEAEAEEREALAQRFGLVSLERFVAEGTVMPGADRNLVRLEAHMIADVVQSCVVTLTPVADRIESLFERLYGTDVEDEFVGDVEPSGDSFLIPEEELLPEPLIDGSIDVGEAAAEQLALELNPFPRGAGAVFEGLTSDPRGASEASRGTGAFAALAALREKQDKQA